MKNTTFSCEEMLGKKIFKFFFFGKAMILFCIKKKSSRYGNRLFSEISFGETEKERKKNTTYTESTTITARRENGKCIYYIVYIIIIMRKK